MVAGEFRYLGNRVPLDQPMPSELSFFGGPRSADLEVIALLAIASTVFVHCNLLRRTWFLAFLAVAAVIQLCLVIAFLGIDLDRREFRLFASTDVLAFVGLAFCLEKLVSLREHERIRLKPFNGTHRPATGWADRSTWRSARWPSRLCDADRQG